MKITKIKKPKNSKYIPRSLDDPWVKKKGQRANPMHELMQEISDRIARDIMKAHTTDNALFEEIE